MLERSRIVRSLLIFLFLILRIHRAGAGVGPSSLKDGVAEASEFLLLCMTDGSLVTMDAWTGRLQSQVVTDPLLQKNSAKNDDDSSAIIPGLDGRLYAYSEDSSYLQALPLTIHSILEHPVKSCPEENSPDCGILTATAQTSLLALSNKGELLWKSNDLVEAMNQPALLLQRRDYWVQHVSIATGQQAWNISLGTYQALDFSSAFTAPDDLVIDDDDVDDDVDDDSLPSEASGALPSIHFSNSGHTLTAVDPDNGNVLWSQTTRSVLSSVFGIRQGQWKSLTVLDHTNDDGTPDATGLTKTTTRSTEKWSQAAWDAARWHYRNEKLNFNSHNSQKLLPSPSGPPEREERRLSESRAQCPTGDCRTVRTQQCLPEGCKEKKHHTPEFLRLPHSTSDSTTARATTNTSTVVQPGGLLLSWQLVESLVFLFVLFAAGLHQWYLTKKRKWLSGLSKETSVPDKMFSSPSTNSTDYGSDRRLRRSASMPDTNTPSPLLRHKSDPGEIDVILRSMHSSPVSLQDDSPHHNRTMTPVLAPRKELNDDEPPVIQMSGVPLVRYSRYASEFEEIEAMGKGGFGTVFRCKNVLDGREYAVKKVSIHGEIGVASFQKRLQRVLREVKILAVLDHPNIVRYYTAWLEVEKEEEKSSLIKNDKGGGTEGDGLSRCYSSSLIITDSVSHWDQDSSRIKQQHKGCRSYHARPRTAFGWDSEQQDEGYSGGNPQMGLGRHYSDFSFMEASNDDFQKASTTSAQDETTTEVRHSAENENGTSYMANGSGHDERQPSSEASATGSIRHTLYIQMQLCSPRTIAEFLEDEVARKASAERGVDIPTALQLFLQISQAVQYVHDQGLIHRDLKPSNCFMDSSGSIKVGDFGLSREAASENGTSLMNVSSIPRRESVGTVDGHTAGVGTRAYASPEQTNASNYDASTDVYSLGIMLFELCYPMYTGMERNICLSRLRENVFPDDWQETVGASFPTLKGLICRMLSIQPSDRPTAAEVARAIQSILSEFTILSLDNKHGPEMILLRVEAEHRDDALGHTIKLIQAAAEGRSPVNVIQYGLRSSSSDERPAAIMEFALQSSDPEKQGPELVSLLAQRPGILKVRQVSRVTTNSK